MTLQEILQAVDELSVDEQTSLLNSLQAKLSPVSLPAAAESDQARGDRFWQGVLNFRAAIAREGLVFTDDDFANLRDRSPGDDHPRNLTSPEIANPSHRCPAWSLQRAGVWLGGTGRRKPGE